MLFGVVDVPVGENTDYLELNTVTGAFAVLSFHAPTPSRDATRRVMQLVVSVNGSNLANVENRLRALERVVNLVGAGKSAAGLASGVTLSTRGSVANGLVHWDVTEAEISYPNSAFETLFGFTMDVPLRLTCMPWGRGEAITDGETVITAADPLLYRAAIPGDEPALVTWEVESTGVPLNAVSIGQRSLADLDDGDFAGVYVAQAISPATDVAFADAIGGSIARYSSMPAGAWSDIAEFTPSAPFPANAGEFDLMLRVRDNSVTAGTPFNLYFISSLSGTVITAVYQTAVTALTVAGESGSSNVFAIVIGGGMRFTWEMSSTANITGYRFYWKRDTQPWKWKNTGSTALTYDFTSESGATIGNPPAATTGAPPARYRLLLSLPSGVTTLQLRPVDAAISNGQWEWLHVGTEQLPPTVRAELGSTRGWRAVVQVIPGLTNNQEVNALALLPCDQQQVHARFRAMNLASNRTFLFGSDRQERDYGVLLNGSTEAGALDVRGPALAGPGDTQFVFIPQVAGSVATVTGVSLAVRPRFIPRYRGPFKGEA